MTNPIGPKDARIMVVGEAPGEKEDKKGVPFVGASGRLLAQLLHQTGFPVLRPSSYAEPDEMVYIWENSGVYLTNVARSRPPSNSISKFFGNKTEAKREGLPEILGRYPRAPILKGMDHLYQEIDEVQPNLIIALGGTSLWALTGKTAITSWRGSMMESFPTDGGRTVKVVPSIHPALVLRQWPWRNLLAHDLRTRCLPESKSPEIPEPNYNFIVAPSFDQAQGTLRWLLDRLDSGEQIRLASDVETRRGQIACEGLAWSDTDAICVPLMTAEPPFSYWSQPEEEAHLVWLIKLIHEHPNALIVGQNFNYDREYFAKLWGFRSRMYMDTMTAHHTLWPAMKKSLEFLSSLYCEYHRYWKDESNEWDPKIGEQQLWHYNCKDVVVTWEVSQKLEELLDSSDLRPQYDFQMRMEEHVFTSWLRGVRYDNDRRNKMGMELVQQIQKYQNWFIDLLGVDKLNPKSQAYWFDSPDQLKKLFYEDLGIKPVLNKDKRPTTDKNALAVLKKREPLVAPLCDALLEYRSLGVYYNTFIKVSLDPSDTRFRCESDVNGTETFRFSSRSDGFNVGANIQNVPAGEEDD